MSDLIRPFPLPTSSPTARAARTAGRQLGRLLAAALGVVLALGLAAAPASAETLSLTDRRGDATARLDLTRSTFVYARRAVAVQVRVANLTRQPSSVGLNLRPAGTFDISWYARSIRRDGRLSTRLYYYSAAVSRRLRCRIDTSWHTGRDTVSLRVPLRCLRGATVTQRLLLTSSTGDPRRLSSADYSRTVGVRRG